MHGRWPVFQEIGKLRERPILRSRHRKVSDRSLLSIATRVRRRACVYLQCRWLWLRDRRSNLHLSRDVFRWPVSCPDLHTERQILPGPGPQSLFCERPQLYRADHLQQPSLRANWNQRDMHWRLHPRPNSMLGQRRSDMQCVGCLGRGVRVQRQSLRADGDRRGMQWRLLSRDGSLLR